MKKLIWFILVVISICPIAYADMTYLDGMVTQPAAEALRPDLDAIKASIDRINKHQIDIDQRNEQQAVSINAIIQEHANIKQHQGRMESVLGSEVATPDIKSPVVYAPIKDEEAMPEVDGAVYGDMK